MPEPCGPGQMQRGRRRDSVHCKKESILNRKRRKDDYGGCQPVFQLMIKRTQRDSQIDLFHSLKLRSIAKGLTRFHTKQRSCKQDQPCKRRMKLYLTASGTSSRVTERRGRPTGTQRKPSRFKSCPPVKRLCSASSQ